MAFARSSEKEEDLVDDYDLLDRQHFQIFSKAKQVCEPDTLSARPGHRGFDQAIPSYVSIISNRGSNSCPQAVHRMQYDLPP